MGKMHECMTDIEYHKKLIEMGWWLRFYEKGRAKIAKDNKEKDFDFKESEEKIKKYDEFLRDSRYEIIKIEEEEERKYKERTKQLITKFSKYQV
jgi:hypothetical protein